MSQAVVASDRLNASEVPFHGQYEGYAKLYSGLAVVSAVTDMAMPWMWLHRQPALHFVRGISVDVLGLSVMTTYFSLYKRLSRRIALGGADAVFLDQLRREMASMVTFLLMLAWVLWSTGIFGR